MNTEEQILNVMAKADAQNPMPLADIANKSGMDAGQLKNLLDGLNGSYPSKVNRAHIMRKGEWEWYYWHTAMVQKPAWGSFVVSKSKPQATPPRRNETTQQATPVIEKKEPDITSDRTLMILNLQDQPIELDVETTAALDSFLGDLWLNERMDVHTVAGLSL